MLISKCCSDTQASEQSVVLMQEAVAAIELQLQEERQRAREEKEDAGRKVGTFAVLLKMPSCVAPLLFGT